MQIAEVNDKPYNREQRAILTALKQWYQQYEVHLTSNQGKQLMSLSLKIYDICQQEVKEINARIEEQIKSRREISDKLLQYERENMDFKAMLQRYQQEKREISHRLEQSVSELQKQKRDLSMQQDLKQKLEIQNRQLSHFLNKKQDQISILNASIENLKHQMHEMTDRDHRLIFNNQQLKQKCQQLELRDQILKTTNEQLARQLEKLRNLENQKKEFQNRFEDIIESQSECEGEEGSVCGYSVDGAEFYQRDQSQDQEREPFENKNKNIVQKLAISRNIKDIQQTNNDRQMLSKIENNFGKQPDAMSGYYGKRFDGVSPRDSENSRSRLSVRSGSEASLTEVNKFKRSKNEPFAHTAEDSFGNVLNFVLDSKHKRKKSSGNSPPRGKASVNNSVNNSSQIRKQIPKNKNKTIDESKKQNKMTAQMQSVFEDLKQKKRIIEDLQEEIKYLKRSSQKTSQHSWYRNANSKNQTDVQELKNKVEYYKTLVKENHKRFLDLRMEKQHFEILSRTQQQQFREKENSYRRIFAEKMNLLVTSQTKKIQHMQVQMDKKIDRLSELNKDIFTENQEINSKKKEFNQMLNELPSEQILKLTPKQFRNGHQTSRHNLSEDRVDLHLGVSELDINSKQSRAENLLSDRQYTDRKILSDRQISEQHKEQSSDSDNDNLNLNLKDPNGKNPHHYHLSLSSKQNSPNGGQIDQNDFEISPKKKQEDDQGQSEESVVTITVQMNYADAEIQTEQIICFQNDEQAREKGYYHYYFIDNEVQTTKNEYPMEGSRQSQKEHVAVQADFTAQMCSQTDLQISHSSGLSVLLAPSPTTENLSFSSNYYYHKVERTSDSLSRSYQNKNEEIITQIDNTQQPLQIIRLVPITQPKSSQTDQNYYHPIREIDPINENQSRLSRSGSRHRSGSHSRIQYSHRRLSSLSNSGVQVVQFQDDDVQTESIPLADLGVQSYERDHNSTQTINKKNVFKINLKKLGQSPKLNQDENDHIIQRQQGDDSSIQTSKFTFSQRDQLYSPSRIQKDKDKTHSSRSKSRLCYQESTTAHNSNCPTDRQIDSQRKLQSSARDEKEERGLHASSIINEINQTIEEDHLSIYESPERDAHLQTNQDEIDRELALEYGYAHSECEQINLYQRPECVERSSQTEYFRSDFDEKFNFKTNVSVQTEDQYLIMRQPEPSVSPKPQNQVIRKKSNHLVTRESQCSGSHNGEQACEELHRILQLDSIEKDQQNENEKQLSEDFSEERTISLTLSPELMSRKSRKSNFNQDTAQNKSPEGSEENYSDQKEDQTTGLKSPAGHSDSRHNNNRRFLFNTPRNSLRFDEQQTYQSENQQEKFTNTHHTRKTQQKQKCQKTENTEPLSNVLEGMNNNFNAVHQRNFEESDQIQRKRGLINSRQISHHNHSKSSNLLKPFYLQKDQVSQMSAEQLHANESAPERMKNIELISANDRLKYENRGRAIIEQWFGVQREFIHLDNFENSNQNPSETKSLSLPNQIPKTEMIWESEKVYIVKAQFNCQSKVKQQDEFLLWKRGILSLKSHKYLRMIGEQKVSCDPSSLILGSSEISAWYDNIWVRKKDTNSSFEGDLEDNNWKVLTRQTYTIQ